MDSKKLKEAAGKMTKARALLVRNNPFFGHLALRLQLACAPCGTACTDGTRLIFDPDFAEELSEREMQFVFLHEVLHCALEHCTRGRSFNNLLFNMACDIVVNSTILSLWGISTFTVAGNEVMHLAPNGIEGYRYSAEEVYQMLLNDPQNNNGIADSKIRLTDDHAIWNSITDIKQHKDTWDKMIQDAARECSNDPGIPDKMRSIINSLENRTKVNWKQVLHDFIQFTTYDYSFTPPDRRFSDSDFYLPAYNLDELSSTVNDIWVCVDVSASVSDKELSYAMGETLDAIRQVGLKGCVSFFSTSVTKPVPFDSAEDIKKLRLPQGGGTRFDAIFKYMKQQLYPNLPKAIIIFTDGYATQPPEKDALGVPVLWVIYKNGRSDLSWGKVIKLE